MIRTAWVLGMVAAGGMLIGLAAGCEAQKAQPSAAKAPAAAPVAPVSELVLPAPGASAVLTEANFVMNWRVLGPFKFKETDFAGEHQQASADHPFVPNEGQLAGTQEAPAGTSWQNVLFKGEAQAGQVNLDALYGGAEYVAAYAVAWLDCPQVVPDAKLYVGSDDYIKVWVNGECVHTFKTARRASSPDQDVVPNIRLKKGLNRIVVKCVDIVFDFDFYFRLTDAKGGPMAVKTKAP